MFHDTPPDHEPASTGDVSHLIGEHFQQKGPPFELIGGGTSLVPGRPRSEGIQLLSTRRMDREIDYPAGDMTITVEAGMTVDALNRRLAQENQRLPVDIPFPDRSTIGGALALNLSGPGHFAHGTLRDYLIGIRAVDGQGRVYKAGGRVVKNVAGYDLCKLMIGSRGTLGVLTEVTLKLRPQAPFRICLVYSGLDAAVLEQAIATALRSGTRPLAIEAFSIEFASTLPLELPHEDGLCLCIAFEGTESDVQWQVQTLKQELAAILWNEPQQLSAGEADPLWVGLTEFQFAGHRNPQGASLRATLPSSATSEALRLASNAGWTVQAHAANGIINAMIPEFDGAARQALQPVVDWVLNHQGRIRPRTGPAEWQRHLRNHFPTRSGNVLAARLKSTFDPERLLNPGLEVTW